MQEYIQKAQVLIEALPYIQSFRNKTVVIKFGGSVMTQKDFLEGILRDVVFMECVGINPVIIHGGGPRISEKMKAHGKVPKFVEGLRVTDAQTMRMVEETLLEINQELVDVIQSFGGRAKGISGRTENMILVTQHPLVETRRADGTVEAVDIGFVGEVKLVNAEPIRKAIQKQSVAVVTPIGVDLEGNAYNINGDHVASQLSGALKAEKLVYLSDVNGVMSDPKDPNSLFSTLGVHELKHLIETGVITGGMLPKVKSCIRAVEAGVQKTHIIDGRVLHSLLLEIFTDKGIGTEIFREGSAEAQVLPFSKNL
ncbi:MAG: acetylglutamate kinase [Chlamydiae bacterium]|nr:acetylglutamate kinase [Chlamydiota bacterium]MBI3265803.1 acetylglutamate kinase [Chlamydiota bacterium]